MENNETIEERDDLEDLIDDNTDYYWNELSLRQIHHFSLFSNF